MLKKLLKEIQSNVAKILAGILVLGAASYVTAFIAKQGSINSVVMAHFQGQDGTLNSTMTHTEIVKALEQIAQIKMLVDDYFIKTGDATAYDTDLKLVARVNRLSRHYKSKLFPKGVKLLVMNLESEERSEIEVVLIGTFESRRADRLIMLSKDAAKEIGVSKLPTRVEVQILIEKRQGG